MDIYRSDNSEVNKLLGYQNIMNNTGYILAALAISYLVTLSWYDVFWVYIIAIPVLFLFQHFVDRTFDLLDLHFLHGFSL